MEKHIFEGPHSAIRELGRPSVKSCDLRTGLRAGPSSSSCDPPLLKGQSEGNREILDMAGREAQELTLPSGAFILAWMFAALAVTISPIVENRCGFRVREMGVGISALPLTSCVTWGKPRDLSEHFLHPGKWE